MGSSQLGSGRKEAPSGRTLSHLIRPILFMDMGSREDEFGSDQESVEDDNGAILDDDVAVCFAITDLCEDMVYVVVMDCVTPAGEGVDW